MNNTYGANWELSKLPTAPFDLRVTTKSGKTTVIRWVLGLSLDFWAAPFDLRVTTKSGKTTVIR
jgi:hypothetical protein